MENLPTIEVVFVSKSEDLLLLKKVIIAAYNCSVNKITKICLIVPFSEVTFCQDALKHLEFFDIINIVSEELIVSTSVIELIRKERPDRFGCTRRFEHKLSSDRRRGWHQHRSERG